MSNCNQNLIKKDKEMELSNKVQKDGVKYGDLNHQINPTI
jgi:hypothetical protein